MKKLYIYLFIFLSFTAFNSYAQNDCSTAVTAIEGTNYLDQYDYYYWYTYTAGTEAELITIGADYNYGDVYWYIYSDCIDYNTIGYGSSYDDPTELFLAPNQTIKIYFDNYYSYQAQFPWELTVDIVPATNANYYWVGNGGDWSDFADHWATTSGGTTFHTAPPNYSDNVFFDSESFTNEETVNVDVTAYCNNMDWTGALSGTQFYANSSNRVKVYGNLTMANGVYRDVFYFDFGSLNSTEKTIDMADNTVRKNSGIDWDGRLTFDVAGIWNLTDSIHAEEISINGQLNTNNYPIHLTNQLRTGGNGSFNAGTSVIQLNNLYNYSGSMDFSQATLNFKGDNGSIGTYSGISFNDVSFENTGDSRFNLSGNNIFNNAVFNSGDFNFNGTNTFNDLVLNSGVSAFLRYGYTQTVTNNFTVAGSRSQLVQIRSTSQGNPATLDLGSSSYSVSYALIEDNTVTTNLTPGTKVTAFNSLEVGANNMNWDIQALVGINYYWVGGTGTWSNAAHWATTSGGSTFRAEPPGPTDFVFFDEYSFPDGGTITLDVEASCTNMTWTNNFTTTKPTISAISDYTPLNIYGNLIFANGVKRDITNINFSSSNAQTIKFAETEVYTTGYIRFVGTGSWTLQDHLSAYNLSLDGGATFNTNGQVIEIAGSIDFNDGTLNLGSSDVYISTLYGPPANLNAGTSTIYFSSAYLSQAYTLNNVNFNDYASINGNCIFNNAVFNGSTTLNGNCTFNNVTFSAGSTTSLRYGYTQTVNQALVISGERSNMAELKSSYYDGSQPAFITTTNSSAPGNYSVNYAILKGVHSLYDNGVAPVATNVVTNNSIDNSGNLGFDFISNQLTSANFYWLGGQGDWSDPANWSTPTPNGSNSLNAAPGILDNVTFADFTASSDTVFLDLPVRIRSMTWQDGTLNPVLAPKTDNYTLTLSGSLLFSSGVSSLVDRFDLKSTETTNYLNMAGIEGTPEFRFSDGGTWTLQDSIASSYFYVSSGILKTNGHSIYSSGSFNIYDDRAEYGNSNIYALSFYSNGPIQQGTETIYIAPGGSFDMTSNTGNKFNTVVFEGDGSFYRGTVKNLRAENPGSTISFSYYYQAYISNSMVLTGSPSGLLNIVSDYPESQATINMPITGTVTADYITVKDNNATGGATFTATNSSKFDNVTGWTGLKTGQTITFSALSDRIYSEPFDMTGLASSDSGLPITYLIDQGDGVVNGNVVTANTSGLFKISATQAGTTVFGPASSTKYIHFNATDKSNELGMFKEATYVIGQANFVSNETTLLDDRTTIYPTSGLVTSDGKFLSATGRRVLIWNEVPGALDIPADVVVGQANFISDISARNPSSFYSSIYSAAVSNDGKLLVADYRGIMIWNTVPTENGTAADVIIGQDNFYSSAFGTSANRFQQGKYLAITSDNKLIVSDQGNNRVLIYNQIPTENNADADIVIGQDDFTSRSYGTGANRFSSPSGLAISPDGKLLITDYGNNRVLVFNSIPTTNGASANYVLGQTNMNSAAYGTSATSFYNPYDVSVSRTGKLAVADRYNNRVLIYNTLPLNNTTGADYVLGQPDFDSRDYNNSGLSGRSLAYPRNVCWDTNENLYVTDTENSRHLVWGLPDFIPPVIDIASSTIATTYVKGANTTTKIVFEPDESGIENVDIRYRYIANTPADDPINWPSGTLTPETDGSYIFNLNIIDDVNEKLGMRYYIVAMDGAGNITSTINNIVNANIRYPSGIAMGNYGVGDSSDDYRLLSVPLDFDNATVGDVFGDILNGPYNKSILRVYSYGGGSATTYTEANSSTSLEIGKGYFALAALGSSTSVTTGAGETVYPFSRPLVNGWNLIGNPYPFSVSWAEILTTSGLTTELALPVTYEGGPSWPEKTMIEAGKGYFVNNISGSSVTVTFPTLNTIGDRIAGIEENKNSLAEDSWEVRLTMKNNNGSYVNLAAVGMEQDADPSFDYHDRINPPALVDHEIIEFNHPEFFQPSFRRDVRPTNYEEKWEFTYAAAVNEEERSIHWDNTYFGDNSPELFLLDKTHFKVINMKEESNYNFTHSGETKFEVYFGYDAYQALRPDYLTGITPYPNPFTDQVKINVGIPETSINQKIVVSIYNTLGKQVASLNTFIEGDAYMEFIWNGTNDSGQEVPDGLYAFRVIVEGGTNEYLSGKLIKE